MADVAATKEAPVTTTAAASVDAKVTAPAPAAPAPAATVTAAADATKAAAAAPWMSTEPKKPDAAKVEPEGTKEDVKYELKAPEGVSMDASALEGYVSFAKENGLTPAQAQKLLDRDVAAKKQADDAVWEQVRKTDAENLKAIQTAWGDKFGEKSERVKRAFDYVDPDGSLRKEMESIGVAHHRPLVEAFLKVGDLLANDSLRTPSIAGPAAKDNRTPHEKARDYYAQKMAEQQGKVLRK